MKLSMLIPFLFLASLHLSAQKDGDAIVYNDSMWTTTDPTIYFIDVGPYSIAQLNPKEVFKEMLTEYLNQLPSHPQHETNLFQGIYLEDCDIEQVESGNGFDMSFYEKCNNPDHVIQIKEKPNFGGFINYVLGL